jgi:hypothetical protein
METALEERMKAHQLIEENYVKEMLKIEERAKLSQEKHEKYMIEIKIQIQEIRASIPKRKIYFGKVKTE